MNILLYSNSPFQASGYATVADNLLERINDVEGHQMDILCTSGIEESQVVPTDKYSIFSPSKMGGNRGFNDISVVYNKFDYDIILTIMDWWIFEEDGQLNIPRIHYCPVDHKELSPMWQNSLHGCMKAVPYTDFGKEELENGGVENVTEPIPHGVDTEVFDKRDVGPDYLGFDEDAFVFGMFKANQGTRLHVVEMLEAFKKFKEENDAEDAKLYLHTQLRSGNGFDLVYWLNKLDLGEETLFVDQDYYRMGTITQKALSKAYSACDVIFNTVKGEGWGLPITEGGACGTPSIATMFSSMPEIIGEDEERGWLVDVDRYEPTLGKHAYRSYPEVDDIAEKMAYVYNHPEEIEEKADNMYEWVQQLDWDKVVEKYWLPLIECIEKEEEMAEGLGPISALKRESQIDEHEFDIINSHLKEVDGREVLELGCGTGILADYLEERGYNVTGVDISEYALKRARKRNLSNVYQMDIQDGLSDFFVEGQFDAIISQHVLEHVDDISVLEEALSLLGDDGFIINIVPSKAHLAVREEPDPDHLRYYSQEDVVRLRDELSDVVVTSHPEGQLDMFIGVKKSRGYGGDGE